jgi:hypothetical protein
MAGLPPGQDHHLHGEVTMTTKFFLRFPMAILAVLALTFTAACDKQPTGIDALGVDDPSFAGIGDTGTTIGDQDAVTPSTNELNKANGWAYVEWNSNDAGVGEAPLKFVSTRSFASCFEYRIDGELGTGDNYNTDITDGLWPFVCVNNSEATRDLVAENYVDVRMVFGAEEDERFDWTRFYVVTELTKDDCKKGQWEALGFKNQGQCIRYVETGEDSRVAAPTPDAIGDIVWTSGGGSPAEYSTQFTIFAAAPGSGTVYTGRTDDATANWTYTVTCVKLEGNQAWFGGVRDDDNAPVIFYAKDDTTDYFDQWTSNTAGHTCANLGSWSPQREVTSGSITIN